MSHALLAIQNILQNSNIFIGSRETVLFTSFGKKKVTQFSGLPPTSVSYLNKDSNPKQVGGGGGGISPQAGSSLCCAETVSSRKLKLCDFTIN